MDTGTHLLVGFGLAGLAAIDPVVSANTTVYGAVMLATVIGSQAPDFDYVIRMKGNASYIRHHRGLSHSIPAVAGWALLITGILQLFYQGALPWLHIAGWTLLAVSFHVFSDCFNSYGTQAGRPFTDKWISWNIIHIFDPFKFISHFIAILLWAFGVFSPTAIFPVLYSTIVLYYLWRTYEHHTRTNLVERLDATKQPGDEYTLIPTLTLNNWNVVKRTADGSFVTGHLRHHKLSWINHMKCSTHEAAERSKSEKAVQAFRYQTKYACAEVKPFSWGYEVRWVDVRYRYRKQFPYVAVVMMDNDYKTLGSYVGWLSEKRIEKRLYANSY